MIVSEKYLHFIDIYVFFRNIILINGPMEATDNLIKVQSWLYAPHSANYVESNSGNTRSKLSIGSKVIGYKMHFKVLCLFSFTFEA